MRWVWVPVVLAVLACSPGAPRPGSGSAASGAPSPEEPSRTLVIAVGRAPESLAAKPLRETRGAGSPRTSQRAFNAGLVVNDDREIPRAYLAEALPQLHSDSWRVQPDGRMETTYRLRPNLTWHDGAALTADDFVFAWRVYATPELGLAASPPLSQMEEVVAADPRTVVIHWRQPFGGADGLQTTDFQPLPRHLLERPFGQLHPDAFVALPFWVAEYVGAGPYRLGRMDLGSFIEGEAFAGHALGRARISAIRLVFIPDANTVLANLLSDAAHVATDNTVDLQQAAILDRDWTAAGGVVLRNPIGVRHANVQTRPEIATPRALLDLRVRRALAHATDRQVLADAITEGLAPPADTLVLPNVEYFPALDRAITKYPYDLRRSEQLMGEAGFAKGADGIYASLGEGRFAFELAVAQGARNEPEVTIMAEGLRRAGFDANIRVIPRAQITEPLVLSTFPGVLNGSHNRAFQPPLIRIRASEIARPETRFRGSNYSGWSHPDVERLVAAYESALDRSERSEYIVEMLRVVSQEVPIFALYYNLEFTAHAGALRGPMVTVSSDASAWNLHEWHWIR